MAQTSGCTADLQAKEIDAYQPTTTELTIAECGDLDALIELLRETLEHLDAVPDEVA
jgi:hypothetical protein